MKKLLLVSMVLASTNLLAGTVCVGEIGQFPISEAIRVKTTVDSKTGLTESIKVSTTYTKFEYCNRANLRKEKLRKPVRPRKSTDLTIKKRCYATSESSNAYYLINESRNPETGVVVELEVLNEFEGIANCVENL